MPSPGSRSILLGAAASALLLSCAFQTNGLGGSTSATSTTTGGDAGGKGGAGGAVGSGGTGGTGGVTSSTAASTGTGGAPPVVCGDGKVQGAEACDDGNVMPGDGCSDTCAVEPGHTCAGEPSACPLIPPQVVTVGPGLNMTIVDPNPGYDGTLATMECAGLPFMDQGFHAIQHVELAIAIDHSYVGDVIIKVISPAGTVLTVLNRPGYDEPADRYDDAHNGDSSNFTSGAAVTFVDGASDDAETMGNGIDGSHAVCQDDGRCTYHPNHGSGPGQSFADFNGQSPAGGWQVCVADGHNNDGGAVQSATLTVLAW
jgi:cysteine-rich repeat protein